jgi:hypothetical protein
MSKIAGRDPEFALPVRARSHEYGGRAITQRRSRSLGSAARRRARLAPRTAMGADMAIHGAGSRAARLLDDRAARPNALVLAAGLQSSLSPAGIRRAGQLRIPASQSSLGTPCVESGEQPRLFGVEPPRPRIAAVRIVDMSSSNAWAEFAGVFCRTRSAFLEHEGAKAELKGLILRTLRRPSGMAFGPNGRSPER